MASLNIPKLNASISPVMIHHAKQNSESNFIGGGNPSQNLRINNSEFDCTSIASVSESSHWSGGNGDDLDNIALVNGSEAIVNKEWSTYLRLSNNTSNSSDEDEPKKGHHQHQGGAEDDDDDEEATNSFNHNDDSEHSNPNANNQPSDDYDDEEAGPMVSDEDDDDEDGANYGDGGDFDDNGNDEDSERIDEDIWTIKPKLAKYYEKQFRSMQPELNGLITGSVAKPFFEKSRLPPNELSRIWELSDVNRDGALSYSEFCTAMHLVVLRVRNFELPDKLPPKLQPNAPPLIDFNTENKAQRSAKNDSLINKHAQIKDSPTFNSPIAFNPQINTDQPIVHPIAVRVNNNTQQVSGAKATESASKHSRSSSLGSIQPPALPPRDTSNHVNVAAAQNDASNNMASAIIYQNQIENSVEQIHNTNVDEMKMLSEKQKLADYKKQYEMVCDDFTEKIRVNRENNLKLKKFYSDLEKELRNLCDTRIALEIKYESLISSTAATSSTLSSSSNLNTSSATVTSTPSTKTLPNSNPHSSLLNSASNYI